MRVETELQLQKSEWKIPLHSENHKESNTVSDHAYIRLDVGTNQQSADSLNQTEKTIESISSQAENSNVALQRDYRTVMSSCMTSEDYAKLEENGYSISDTNIEELVTVTDQIKAELLKAGIAVTGYTDTIDQEALKELTGSEVYAYKLEKKMQEQDLPVNKETIKEFVKSYQMQSEIGSLSENSKKYILENKLEPTISNLYYAAHSNGLKTLQSVQSSKQNSNIATGSHSAPINFEKIQTQITNIINNTELDNTNETDAEAKWLIQNGIALNEENLERLHKLNHLEDYMSDEIRMDSIISSISSGKKGTEAIFYNTCNIYEKAVQTLEQASNFTDDDITVASEKYDNLSIKKIFFLKEKNLNSESELQRINENDQQNQEMQDSAKEKVPESGLETELSTHDKKAITAKRQIEEIRLKMSLEVNIRLLRKGISIDTIELGRLVEELKSEEEQLAQVVMSDVEKESAVHGYREYKMTMSAVTDLKNLPAALIGTSVKNPNFSMGVLYQEGLSLQRSYQEASTSYEKVMTSPRQDLGDSIRTAFRNIPDLLTEIGMEVTQKNQRAVRILAYSQMEVTQENIEKIKVADQEISTMIEKMSPSSVLKMIKEGYHPLDMKISEMTDYLNHVESSAGSEAENYARFLYRMEQNNEITQEEKDSYIGIYRIMRQIEKSDGAFIGQLLSQGAEVNFKNLLSAMRTDKQKGIDMTVSDSAPIYLRRITESSSITEQLGERSKVQYQKNIASEIRSKIENGMFPSGPPQDTDSMEMWSETFTDPDSSGQQNDTSSYQFENEQIRRAVVAESELVTMLNSNKIPVTAGNLIAMEEMMRHMGNQYKNLLDKEKEQQRNRQSDSDQSSENEVTNTLENLFREIQDSLTDNMNMASAYENLQQYAKEMVNEEIDAGNASLDIRSMALTFRQIELGTTLAKQEVYEIPIMIGEEVTSIRLTMIHNESEAGSVAINMDTEQYGKISARFDMNDQQVSGYIIYDDPAFSHQLQSVLDTFEKNLKEENISLNKEQIQLIFHDTPEIKIENDERQTEEVSSQQLYFVAKSLIRSIQNEV